ncbi:hypothetical protein CY0110_15572 [Crocosphaera chwakensis CCY0110]|uniref:Uncharacterized protein n=1 Tax=Crocosphaera chwakensis CCY0110 TaxID=391612 RepID=A3IHE6_9CHRO|nr:hypothetical protein CY0110_15572 [Crocosphaera chwakensis CCY0110]
MIYPKNPSFRLMFQQCIKLYYPRN